jgi:hypothetical protein
VLVVMAIRSERSEGGQGIDLNGPLPGYPPCEEFVPDKRIRTPEGAILPRSALVTRTRPRGPTLRMSGYVPMRPIELRRYYEARADLEVLTIEDEIIEAEALLSDGEFRTFVKAQAVCDEGSTFLAVVAPELAAGEVPVPAGGTPQG